MLYRSKREVTAVQYDGTAASVDRIMEAFGTSGFNNSAEGLYYAGVKKIIKKGFWFYCQKGADLKVCSDEDFCIDYESVKDFWQPIDTAPRDGTRFISLILGFQPTISWWNGSFFINDTLEKYINDDESYFDGLDSLPQPTHWMPLPEPPKEVA